MTTTTPVVRRRNLETSTSPDKYEAVRWWTLVIAVVAVVVGEMLTWLLLRSQGNVITGDSPHYLIAAETLSHLSVHVLPQYQADLASHYIYAWPAGATLTTMGVHAFSGPHGVIFAQGIGLPILLAPFIAIGQVPFALLGFFTFNAIGFVFIHRRASQLADLGRRGQIVFALALAAPAVWLAATQIYPDLLSGIFLACGLLEMAHLERSGTWRWSSIALITVALAVPPWFQIKNFAVAVVAMAGLLLLVYLRRIELVPVLVIVGVVLVSFGLLLIYNSYYFGHLLGLPQPSPNLGLKGIKDTFFLVFDRDQGILVQCPVILFGLLGLWYSRRSTQITNVVVLLGAAAILVINGTQPSVNAFGGVALAGRFGWTVMPMLLAWSPFFLKRLEPYRQRLVAVAVVVSVLWLVQAVPIVIGDHNYFNATFAPFAPWDPSTYPGWWDGVNTYLPSVLSHGGVLAGEILFEAVLVVALTWLLIRLVDPRPIEWARGLAVGGGAVVVVVVLALVVPSGSLPSAPLTWSGQTIGSPFVSGNARVRTSPLDLGSVGTGTYEVTLTEKLTSASGAASRVSFQTTPGHRIVVSNWFSLRHPTSAAVMTVSAPPLDLAHEHVATVLLRQSASVRQTDVTFSTTAASVFSFNVGLGANSRLQIVSMQLRKLTN